MTRRRGRELRWSIHNGGGKVVEKGSGNLHEEVKYLAFKYSSLGKFLDWIGDVNGEEVELKH